MSELVSEIRALQVDLQRHLNDVWIITQLIRKQIAVEADALRNSDDEKKKRSFLVPSAKQKKGIAVSSRLNVDFIELYDYQHSRGMFETNIISMVSRTEAFIQDCLAKDMIAYPDKLSIFTGKEGVPLDLFLLYQDRSEVIRRLVAARCEGLMYEKPKDYISKFEKALSFELNPDIVERFLELKASRDIIIHNGGTINRSYIEKSGGKKRGKIGDILPIDKDYMSSAMVTLKGFSQDIRDKAKEKYK